MLRSAINPEAGDVHAPTDPRLASAVQLAVRLTWRINPYYRLRFGERGWRFSLSDSGWMATLPELGSDHARRQLMWLHRVLANRGMPGWLLEDHLQLMVRVLNRKLPARRDQWRVLDASRAELEARRLGVLSEAELVRRSEAFAAEAGLPSHPLLVGAGRLIHGAWIDGELGMAKAAPSMLEWLADRDRLPDDFCDLVERTVGL